MTGARLAPRPARRHVRRARTDPQSYCRNVESEAELIRRLRDGDESAFGELIDRHHTSLLRMARSFVSSPAVAEEVVQETWLGVVKGIDRFEGRSSIKTWLYTILMNQARTAGVRESRSQPEDLETGPAVSPDRFGFFGHWSKPPAAWDGVEQGVLTREAIDAVYRSLDELPDRQRQVVIMRDVEGLGSDDVCSILGISESNQRVLLHRGRARVRQLLEDHVGVV